MNRRLHGFAGCAVVLLTANAVSPVRAETFDVFVGAIVSRWLPDGRKMELIEDFAYIDPSGKRWTAPKQSVVDGASIPRALWTLIGGPFEGTYRNASVVHDVACARKSESWQDVHRMFYHAMRRSGVEEARALYMYAAVYHFGPRWRRVGGLLGGLKGVSRVEVISRPEPTDAQLDALRAAVEKEGRLTTLDQVERFSP